MVSAQAPVERNKSSLLQAVVWLWTRQSLLTDKLCAMRGDRSRAHVLHALTGHIKSPSLWWFLFLFYLFRREIIKKNRYSDNKEEESLVCFQMDDQSKLVRKVIKTTMRVMRQNHRSGGSGEGVRNSLVTWNHQESWMVLCGGSRSFADDKLSESEILGMI